jgi:hypothetical protein
MRPTVCLCIWAAVASKPCVDMGRTVGIVVPYRDRPVHLRRFTNHMVSYWRREFPCDSMWLYVIEQDDALAFRRAALCNVGIKEVLAAAHRAHVIVDCIVFHDVDLVPDPGVPYTVCTHPTQLGSELEHFNWGVPYAASAGGIVSMRPQDWIAINGMSNNFKGWGGEDDDLHRRLQGAHLLKRGQHLHRPPPGHGRFRIISESPKDHPRARNHPDYRHNLNLLSNGIDWRNDGLAATTYAVNSRAQIKDNVTLVKVSMKITR